MKKRVTLGLFLSFFLLFLLTSQVMGEEAYPTKPIDLIVAVTPGGGVDISARLVAGYLLQVAGIHVNVINKPAGAGIPAIYELMTGRSDGYTMMTEGHAFTSTYAFYTGTLPYDWRKRTFCARITKDPLIYQVRANAPWNTLKEVAEFIKKRPKEIRWGTMGVGGVSTPGLAQFFRAKNIDIKATNRVNFPGEAQVLTALAGGHIDFAAQQYGPSWSLISGKKTRPLAVVSEKRISLLPDVPTVTEAGYPMLNVHGWHGISGPPGLPKHITDFWVRSLEKAAKDPVFLEMAERVKKEVAYLGPKDFVEFVEQEYKKYVELAKYIDSK